MNISTTSCIAAQTPIRRVARSRLFLSGPKTMHTPWELIQDGLFFGLKTANEVSSISIRDQSLFAIKLYSRSRPVGHRVQLVVRPYSSDPAIPRALFLVRTTDTEVHSASATRNITGPRCPLRIIGSEPKARRSFSLETQGSEVSQPNSSLLHSWATCRLTSESLVAHTKRRLDTVP